jgi:hypothetical protein
MAECGAGGEYPAGLNQHAPVLEPDARIALTKEWREPPCGPLRLILLSMAPVRGPAQAAGSTGPPHATGNAEGLPQWHGTGDIGSASLTGPPGAADAQGPQVFGAPDKLAASWRHRTDTIV